MSSALVAGDLFARVNLVFDQGSWNGDWFDEPWGSPATATFNHTQYPIQVTNRGALTERWVVAKHALRNALIPIVAVIGLQWSIADGKGRDSKAARL